MDQAIRLLQNWFRIGSALNRYNIGSGRRSVPAGMLIKVDPKSYSSAVYQCLSMLINHVDQCLSRFLSVIYRIKIDQQKN